ncbi:protein SCO1 homolog, mitochondrial [Chelonus insularis]|uniref:protein SCO1 homolog, mitochondrial n=1 Tax=Chelonus insularis TaxID=460826 RepID=UPI00158E3C58|nr:protein SCO1 homolog, mitochondrial [Chelonus insularis]
MSLFMIRSLRKNIQLCSRVLINQERQFTYTKSVKQRKKDPVIVALEKFKNLIGASNKSPFTWRSFFIGGSIGGLFLLYIFYLQAEKDLKLDKERRRALGKAAIGGKFELVNSKGEIVSSNDFLGQWVLIYFGFTHCPDICPDEIEKMVSIVDNLEKQHNFKIQPIFISVDPERDTPEVVGKYCKEFSDKIIGLTGTPEQVAKACKAYRVYFSNGPKSSDNDYIVDHTIIMYLIDPEGYFVDYYGQSNTAEQVMGSVILHEAKLNKLKNGPSWIPSFINTKGESSFT